MSDDLAIKLHSTTDAVEWAQEFCKRFSVFTEEGVVQDPHGLMLGWFANAIETGRDAGAKDDDLVPGAARYRPPNAEPQAMEEQGNEIAGVGASALGGDESRQAQGYDLAPAPASEQRNARAWRFRLSRFFPVRMTAHYWLGKDRPIFPERATWWQWRGRVWAHHRDQDFNYERERGNW